jgi:hypothetical protein
MCGKSKRDEKYIFFFSAIFTAIRSFSTDFIIAFFGGIGVCDATDSSLLSANDLFRLLPVIALLDATAVDFLPPLDCLFAVDAMEEDDDEKLSLANGGEVLVTEADGVVVVLSYTR